MKLKARLGQITIAYFVSGSITSLTGLDSSKQDNMLFVCTETTKSQL